MPNNNGGLLRDQANIYYVIRFGNYYTGDYGRRGRIVELAPLNNDGSYTYELGYVLGFQPRSEVFLFTDEDVSILVNSLNVYNNQTDDQFVNFPFDLLSPDGGDSILDNHYFDGKIKDVNDNAYFALDPNWKDDSDSSTPRVQIAQGQSDITRHESYFKKELTPKYPKPLTENVKALMQELGISDPKNIRFNDYTVQQVYGDYASQVVSNLTAYLDVYNAHQILIGHGTEVTPYEYQYSDFVAVEGYEQHPFKFSDMQFPMGDNTVTLSGYSDRQLSNYRFFTLEDFECLDGIATVFVNHGGK